MKDLLSELNEDQQKVVLATKGPVLVLAGAGSGKTRALTYRIAYMIQQKIAKPDQILAVTFTNKAANEMKTRVQTLTGESAPLSSIGTFHSIGAKMLREQARNLPRSAGFNIFDADDSERIVRLVMEQLGVSKKEHSPRNIKHAISVAKNKMMSAKDLLAGSGKNDELNGTIYARYEKMLANNDAYDFDDLLIVPLKLLQNHDDIRAQYQYRWQWLAVDEYQDTNPPQDAFLRLLTGKKNNICVVGDDYQAIYSWRGAKVDHILHFEKSFTNCKTIYLTQNYRSTPSILSAANKIIAENKQQMHKKLWTEASGEEPVKLIEHHSGRDEAYWVREEIDEFIRSGGSRKQCAVLYRTNAQSRAFEEEFLMHEVPYTIVGGFRFYERREVKDALALLQLWANPKASLAVRRIADALWSGVGAKTIQNWEVNAESSGVSLKEVLDANQKSKPILQPVMLALGKADSLSFGTVADVLRLLLDKSGYSNWLINLPDGEERWENIEELLNVTSRFADVNQFLEEIALISDIDKVESDHDRVTCMTFHASKGLEFDMVFVVGCEEGLLPHGNSIGREAEIEEERRLLYVGMTRAKKKLFVSHARSRYTHGEVTSQTASRFLDALPNSVVREQIADNLSDKLDSESSSLNDFGVLNINNAEPVVIDVEEGDFVAHKSFGKGVVISTSGNTVTCVFERHGVKTIEASYLVTQNS